MMNGYTFAGFPECGEIAGLPADIAIMGIPHGISYSASVPGHSVKAPMAIRKAAERYGKMIDYYDYDLGGPLLDNSNIRVYDCGDVPGDPSDPMGNQRHSQEKIRARIVFNMIGALVRSTFFCSKRCLKMKKIALRSDHASYKLKEKIKGHLKFKFKNDLLIITTPNQDSLNLSGLNLFSNYIKRILTENITI